MNTVTSQYQRRLYSITKGFSRRISQSVWNIQIKLDYIGISHFLCLLCMYFLYCILSNCVVLVTIHLWILNQIKILFCNYYNKVFVSFLFCDLFLLCFMFVSYFFLFFFFFLRKAGEFDDNFSFKSILTIMICSGLHQKQEDLFSALFSILAKQLLLAMRRVSYDPLQWHLQYLIYMHVNVFYNVESFCNFFNWILIRAQASI